MAVTTTSAKIRRSHVKIDGVSYFRGNALAVRFLCYGKKRTPVTGQNFIDPQGVLPVSKFKVLRTAPFEIDYERDTADELTADAHPAQLAFAGATVDAARKAATAGELKLLMVEVLPSELVDYINHNPPVLRQFSQADNDTRFVHQALVIMKAEIVDHVSSANSASVTGAPDGVVINVTGNQSGGGTTRLVLGTGSLLAYSLGEIEWDADRKNKRTRATGVRLDKWGLG